MKAILILFIILVSISLANAQATSSAVDIVTVYSQNERFYLKSIPYDNEFPTLRGKTYVYQTGKSVPLYVFDRGFDSVDEDSNNLILSNDGEVIFFVIPWEADEKKEGLKSISVYRSGKIIRSFTEKEVNGCDKQKERCTLLYQIALEQIIDQEKSNWGTRNYKKVFKSAVDEKTRFLSDFPIFSSDEIVYVTDSKKNVHLFDLKDGSLVRSAAFDDIFDQLKSKGRFTRTELIAHDVHVYLDFPRLKDGRDPYKSLAAFLKMKPASLLERKDEQYKLYTFEVSLDIARDGSVTVESIDVAEGLPKGKILEFFATNKFDISEIPDAFEKWHFGDEFFSFRNSNDSIARRERQERITEQQRERETRLTLESIDGVYIPKDLGDCFLELDKVLSEVDRKEIIALPEKEDMIQYHMGLGMWMRNTWRLWAGSRLQKYFTDKGIHHPDDMSGVILSYYYDWLHGKKDTWKDWEKNPKERRVDTKVKN